MSMSFWDTKAGYELAGHTIPRIAKSLERIANSLEKTDDEKFIENLFNKMINFAKNKNLQSLDCCKQLRAMWTTYCLCKEYGLKDILYKQDMKKLWDTVVKQMYILGNDHILADENTFAEFMSEEIEEVPEY